MTIIVSVKINDGIIMAADSAVTFQGGQIYHHANKIVNLLQGFPIGVMSTGDGGIANESLETMLKDLRRRFGGDDPNHTEWKLDCATYTMGDVAARIREFLFVEKAQSGAIPASVTLFVCGYSPGRPSGEVWFIQLVGATCAPPILLQAETVYGPRWNGEVEALDRLILGISWEAVKAGVDLGYTEADALDVVGKLRGVLYEDLYMNAMPMQDAIDLARYLVETTTGFIKFSVGRAKTVGGSIEVAAITKHEGFTWVQRKHFFNAEVSQTP